MARDPEIRARHPSVTTPTPTPPPPSLETLIIPTPQKPQVWFNYKRTVDDILNNPNSSLPDNARKSLKSMFKAAETFIAAGSQVVMDL